MRLFYIFERCKALESKKTGGFWLLGLNYFVWIMVYLGLKYQVIVSPTLRKEVLRNNAHWGLILLLWIGVILVASMIAIWGIHMLGPNNYHFLSEGQYQELKSVLFSAALAAFVSEYVRKVM